MIPYRPVDFLRVAYRCSTLREPASGRTTETSYRQFRSLFGCMPKVCSLIWASLGRRQLLPAKANPKHLLWMLFFLKVYATENVTSRFFVCDEKTLRKWVWKLIAAVSRLDVVRIVSDRGVFINRSCWTCVSYTSV
jgi:hypothetical protein